MNARRWTIIFRALANINRLKIIRMLSGSRKMNVSEIAVALEISIKATSNHLAILKNLSVLSPQGVEGHVFYSINSQMPKDFRKTVNLM